MKRSIMYNFMLTTGKKWVLFIYGHCRVLALTIKRSSGRGGVFPHSIAWGKKRKDELTHSRREEQNKKLTRRVVDPLNETWWVLYKIVKDVFRAHVISPMQQNGFWTLFSLSWYVGQPKEANFQVNIDKYSKSMFEYSRTASLENILLSNVSYLNVLKARLK